MSENARRYRRVHQNLKITVKERHVDPEKVRAFETVTGNMGEGGLFIETADPPPKGTILELEFEVPEKDEIINTLALVRWSNKEGMGVRLARFDKEEEDAFSRFIQENVTAVERESRELEELLGEEEST